MKERIISQDQFITAKWEGGETTELFIWPEGSHFQDRAFLFRISSASFTGTRSFFSDFSGYQRYILPIEGELKLSHKGLYERDLSSHEVEYFDGAWKTHSENTPDCRDFNFIYKSGSRALLQVMKEGDAFLFEGQGILTAYSHKIFSLKAAGKGIQTVPRGSLYLMEAEDEVTIQILGSETPVILTVFWLGRYYEQSE